MDILETKANATQDLRDLTGITFMEWVMKKINDANLTNSESVNELIGIADMHLGLSMPDTEKRRVLDKMQKAGIAIMNILDTKADATLTLRELGGASFMQWALKKINDAKLSNNGDAIALTSLVNYHPGINMTDAAKLEILAKMQKAGIMI